MRLLYVTDAYPPMIGGATRSTRQLAQEMALRGHEVYVAASWQPNMPANEQDELVRVFRIRDLTSRLPFISADPYQHVPPPFPDAEAVLRLWRLIRDLRPDVVHTYGWLSHSAALALARDTTPLVMSARDYGNFCAVRTLMHNGTSLCSGPRPAKCVACASRFYGIVKGTAAVAGTYSGRALLRRRLNGLHSVSTYVDRTMRQHLVTGRMSRKASIRVIPNFRTETAEKADPDFLRHLPPDPYILYVGAFRLVKGVEILFEAYRALPDPPPLVMIGTLAPDSPKTFPAGVNVFYDVAHANVMAAWEGALFGVAPSVMPEALGNVVHEAMSRGRAVVGTTAGGQTDLIEHGVSGLLLAPGDSAALGSAMRFLIENPQERTHLGQAAKARVDGLVATQVIPQFERFYEEVVSRNKAPRRSAQ